MTATPTKKARAKISATYKKWYKKNREEFNRKRAEKYAADPARREAANAYAKEYRERNPAKPANGIRYYEYQGAKMEVFKIGVVAEMLNKSIQTIRIWEKAGHIPPPSYESSHRAYTMVQINLLEEFGKMMSEVRYNPAKRAEEISKKSAYIYKMWKRAKLP